MVFAEWIKERLGKERAEFLGRLAHSTCKFTKHDLLEIYSHFKDTHERQLRMRADGLWLNEIENAPPVVLHEEQIARMQ